MTWPVPLPGAVADRMSGAFEQAFRFDEDGNPLAATIDARSPNEPLRVIAVAADESHLELYLYQASLAEELMPDTAQDWLERHADVWGVPREPALPAVGRVILTGAPGLVLPGAIAALSPTGIEIDTAAPATIDASTAVSIPAQAAIPGVAGNLAPGTVLILVSPIAGLASQVAVVDDAGMQGGIEIESLDSWRARILARIREPAHGGKLQDWLDWARLGGAVHVGVYPLWQGAGTVGVVVAMDDGAGPRLPTPAELARIAAVLDVDRPVCAQPVLVPAVLLPVPVTLSITPDTIGVRAAVQVALAAFFAAEQTVGGTIAFSRLDAAVSAAAGDYSNRVTAPAGDVVPAQNQIPVLGPVTFVAA